MRNKPCNTINTTELLHPRFVTDPTTPSTPQYCYIPALSLLLCGIRQTITNMTMSVTISPVYLPCSRHTLPSTDNICSVITGCRLIRKFVRTAQCCTACVNYYTFSSGHIHTHECRTFSPDIFPLDNSPSAF